jgi:hypothetical protein
MKRKPPSAKRASLKRSRFAIGSLAVCHCDPLVPRGPLRVELGGVKPRLADGHVCPKAELQPRKTGRPTGDPWQRITTSLPVELLERARARGKLSDVIEQALLAYLQEGDPTT